ncbi:hypothetical protein [Sphingorhabdus sp.]|uniref:hypothetical protein n=1 Tax=Sphingorhabdus sp. TaxID=1902408 RepID=UPI0033405582
MGELLDTLRGKIWPTPKPTPNPAPITPTKPLSTLDYIRAWKLLKDIPIHKLGPAACSIGFVLFLAISGLFAWIAVILRFMLNIMFMFK